ncbi:MAG TPA: hypothetical protein VGL60_11625 [Acidimicrobiales bacterium]|jgi:hypothetical protein
MTTPNESSSDPVLDALEQLARVLEDNVRDHQVLAERIRSVEGLRAGGGSWREALEAEDDPGTLQLLSRTLARLSLASGVLRKALVVELRGEGNSIPSIARMFGVTHQRVSNLLRQTGS